MPQEQPVMTPRGLSVSLEHGFGVRDDRHTSREGMPEAEHVRSRDVM